MSRYIALFNRNIILYIWSYPVRWKEEKNWKKQILARDILIFDFRYRAFVYSYILNIFTAITNIVEQIALKWNAKQMEPKINKERKAIEKKTKKALYLHTFIQRKNEMEWKSNRREIFELYWIRAFASIEHIQRMKIIPNDWHWMGNIKHLVV